MPRREAELRAALDEARRERERVALQARAILVDFEAAVRSATSIRELEAQKLARLDDQIDKARLRAPRDGFVVYARRDRDDPPIQAGVEVREREEILSIPSSDGMLAEIKLHESVIEKVELGHALHAGRRRPAGPAPRRAASRASRSSPTARAAGSTPTCASTTARSRSSAATNACARACRARSRS